MRHSYFSLDLFAVYQASIIFQFWFVRCLPGVTQISGFICLYFARCHSYVSLDLFSVYRVSLIFQSLFVYILPGVLFFKSWFVCSLPGVTHMSNFTCLHFTRCHSYFSLDLIAVYQVSLICQSICLRFDSRHSYVSLHLFEVYQVSLIFQSQLFAS